MKIVAF